MELIRCNHSDLISTNEDVQCKDCLFMITLNNPSDINQVSIINNQALKISDLESEVKRLEKIVIGLSERLINLK